MCIFSYWIYYVAPGCIVHLPLTTVGVCVDPVGVGQVYVGGNIHVLPGILPEKILPGILKHSTAKIRNASSPALVSIDAVLVRELPIYSEGW